MKLKHTPIRTCVACRTTSEKRGLLRVVRQPDGMVLHDAKGKLSGRGVYVCASPECIGLARKQKKLERALKVGVLPEALFEELNARVMALETKAPNGQADDGNTDAARIHSPQRAHLAAQDGLESEAKNV